MSFSRWTAINDFKERLNDIFFWGMKGKYDASNSVAMFIAYLSFIKIIKMLLGYSLSVAFFSVLQER